MFSKSVRWRPARLLAPFVLVAGLAPGLAITESAAQPLSPAQEISPACGDYHPNVVVVDGMVRKPTTLTVAQLAALPDQQTLDISFLDRLNNTQSHTEHGPLLWTVLS